MAYGIPGKNGQHIVFDFATSAMSMGEFNKLVAAGVPIPEGILLDGYGNPTTEFKGFRGPPRGVMLPFGGHKGSGLHLISGILGGLLSGNGRGMSWLDRGASAINGVFLQAIAVEEFMPLTQFEDEVAELGAFIRSRKPAPGFDEVLLPGDRSRRVAERQLRDGIEIDAQGWERLLETARELGVMEAPPPVEFAPRAVSGSPVPGDG